MSDNALLRLSNLEKSIEGTKILRGISLDVQPGEFVTLLGPSGCGKTTTLRIIAGLLAPDAGTVSLEGRDITALAPEKRDVNTVFQNYALFPHMNVEKNISYGLRVRGMKKPQWQQRVREMLRLVQLEGYEKRMPSQLSGGQRQRVAIARAVVLNPSCSCSTSRSARWTSSCASRCSRNSRTSRSGWASPSSISPTTRKRR